MAAKKGRSVRVRGTCKSGHITETTSAPGRVRWEGSCATPGCDLEVRASRVPAETPAAKATDAVPVPADNDSNDPHRGREVTSYGQQRSSRARREHRPAPQPAPAAAEPAEPVLPDADGGGGGGQPGDAGVGDSGGARRRRIGFRRAVERGRRAERRRAPHLDGIAGW